MGLCMCEGESVCLCVHVCVHACVCVRESVYVCEHMQSMYVCVHASVGVRMHMYTFLFSLSEVRFFPSVNSISSVQEKIKVFCFF